MKKLKKHLPMIFLMIVFFVGLSVLLYPTVSNWWNSRVQSRAVVVYDSLVNTMSEKEYNQYFITSEDYNRRLKEIGSSVALADPEVVEGYEEALNITENGVMGVIQIDKIDVKLPIYHGTSASVLQSGAGHLEGSSLPIGGEGTHSVISAHRGLPSSLLFTHLDRMEIGDVFTVTVLNRVLTYEVDQILTVLPTEIEELYIEDGKDYCTLMTCTPYGINTHRLLVRGRRIYPEEETEETVEGTEHTESDQEESSEWITWLKYLAGAVLLIFGLSEILVRIIQAIRGKGKGK